jgi:hypothetical protein
MIAFEMRFAYEDYTLRKILNIIVKTENMKNAQ